jgi:hypothetical protein
MARSHFIGNGRSLSQLPSEQLFPFRLLQPLLKIRHPRKLQQRIRPRLPLKIFPRLARQLSKKIIHGIILVMIHNILRQQIQI